MQINETILFSKKYANCVHQFKANVVEQNNTLKPLYMHMEQILADKNNFLLIYVYKLNS